MNSHSPNVVLAHDYLTQTGGAERVVLHLADAFPQVPIYTSVYEPSQTFPDFKNQDIRTSSLQHIGFVRRNHRSGLLFYPVAFRRLKSHADVAICSTSGWAHGLRCDSKILYVHNTARWLYQIDDYFPSLPWPARKLIALCLLPFRYFDQRAAAEAAVVLANSGNTAARIREHWGRQAIVVPPPHGMDIEATREPIPTIVPGYVLAVSRLLPYKHVDAIIRAAALLPGMTLVIVGEGPERRRLQDQASAAVRFLPRVSDPQLRWLYANCAALVAAAEEDLGLVPLEAMAFGKPVAALRRGGYLETVIEGTTGAFFEEPNPEMIAETISQVTSYSWDRQLIMKRAAEFGAPAFIEEMQRIVQSLIERIQ